MRSGKALFGVTSLLVLALLLALAMPAAGQMRQQTSPSTAPMTPSEFKGSDFLDRSVKNAEGQDLGQVHDFIISRNGKLQWLILSTFDGKLVAVPYSYFTVASDGTLTYNVTREQLARAGTFRYEDWGMAPQGFMPYSYSAPQYGFQYGPQYWHQYGPQYGRSESHFGYGYGESPRAHWGGYAPCPPNCPPGWRSSRAFTPSRMSGDSLIGREIVGMRGEDLGHVQDLLISRDGRVTGIVVASAEDMTKTHVIQPFSFRMDANGNLMANFTRESLKSAPAFRG